MLNRLEEKYDSMNTKKRKEGNLDYLFLLGILYTQTGSLILFLSWHFYTQLECEFIIMCLFMFSTYPL